MMDANDTSRHSAILIWIVAAAIICMAATWPRWHNTPSANATNSSSASTGGSASTSAAAPGQASVSTVAAAPAAPPAASSAPNNTAINAAGASISSVSTTAAHRAHAAAPSHVSEVTVVPTAVEDWQHLNDKQHVALAPFVDEWAHLPDSQKRKWLAIAAVYQRMSPDEQQRLHARMLRWVQMTPDERTIARENYQMSRVLPPGARQEAWRAYEALSPAQKAKLAAAERARRRKLVVSAPPGTHMPLTSRDASKNGPVGASATLSTEKLVPLVPSGGASGSVASASNGATVAPNANQPPATSPPDTHGIPPKSAKGVIGNLNVGDADRP